MFRRARPSVYAAFCVFDTQARALTRAFLENQLTPLLTPKSAGVQAF